MADPITIIGLTASIVQLIQFGVTVYERLEEFTSEANDVPETFRQVQLRLSVQIDGLRLMQDQWNRKGPVNDTTARVLGPLVEASTLQIKKLQDIFTEILPAPVASHLTKKWRGLKSLSYDKKVKQIVAELEKDINALIFHRSARPSSPPMTVSQQTLVVDLEAFRLKRQFAVPFRRDGLFVGRTEILAEIQSNMQNDQHCIVLAGIGGIGKSQIAIECCYRYKEEQPDGHVFWVHASNITRFEQGYRDIARKLDLPGINDPQVDIMQVVSDWLSDDQNGPWLMVVDNADDKDLIFVNNILSAAQATGTKRSMVLMDYLPQSSRGLQLITTRDERVGMRLAEGEPINIPPFGPSEARQLLKNRYPKSTKWEESETTELLEELNYLPLAIAQAASYIKEEGVKLSSYLAALRQGDQESKALLQRDYPESRRDKELRNSILQTWTLSFMQIKTQKPRSVEILSLMAVLDRSGVAENLLRNKDEGGVSFDTAIGTLKAFSLINEDESGGIFGMHRLVQLSMQSWLEVEGVISLWHGKALETVLACCPTGGGYETWPVWETISPHVRAVLGFTFDTESLLLQRAQLLHAVAEYDEYRGQYVSAYTKAMEAHQIRQKYLGETHSDTLSSSMRIAKSFSFAGNHDEAEKRYQIIMETYAKMPEKEVEASFQSTLAWAEELLNQNKALEAAKELEILYSRCIQLLGANNALTLAVMIGLAKGLGSTGDHEQSVRLLKTVLTSYMKDRGSEDEKTLWCMSALGLELYGAGRPEEAMHYFEIVLDACRRALGNDHLLTCQLLANLGACLDDVGKKEESIPLFRESLAYFAKTNGYEYLDTKCILYMFVSNLRDTGNDKEAEEVEQQAVMMSKEALTVSIDFKMGTFMAKAHRLLHQNQNKEAEELLRPVVEERLQLGHIRSTTMCLALLIATMNAQGKYPESEALLRQVQQAESHQTEALKSRPNVAHLRHAMAKTLILAGKPAEAEPFLREALTSLKSSCMKRHKYVRDARFDLAQLVTQLERYEEAEQLWREVVESSNEVLGPDDPFSIECLRLLEETVRLRAAEAAGELDQEPRLESEVPELEACVGNVG